jgi:hypothetical protein
MHMAAITLCTALRILPLHATAGDATASSFFHFLFRVDGMACIPGAFCADCPDVVHCYHGRCMLIC